MSRLGQGGVVRPRLARSARVVVPVCVGLLILGLIFNGDAIALVVVAVVAILGLWALGVRTKVLFVNGERAGVRYFGRIERSTSRGELRTVVGHAGARLILMGDRRRPLCVLNTADWTEDQVAVFLDRVGVPVTWR